jgi:alkanesulfonate monooxygenase SsuD/methylene tetrahydromethanopterin reductase-like flavin-dependent oxidoreductase (luciferase family)
MLSGYRFALGVGAGWLVEEMELLGHDPRTRGRRMDEMIDVLRRYWDDGVAEYHGEFYDVPPSGMFPVPAQHIPIWVGGRSDIALRRAARNDGWLGMNYDVADIPVLLAKLRDERKRHLDVQGDGGRPFETLVIANAVPTRALYADLEDQGVTSTVCVAWNLGDPAFASFESKRDAMAAFASAFF